MKDLVPLDGSSISASTTAAFGILGRLKVTHINFIFFLFAHITFLTLLVVSLILGCVSRAE